MRLRNSLTEKERERRCVRIREQLVLCEMWKQAESVLTYVSYGTEVSTRELIGLALLEGKRVFCPRVEGKKIEFYRILSENDLTPGFRGILEPDGKTERFERKGQEETHATLRQRASDGALPEKSPKALLLAPGTVFDRKGNRMGYGGGYYDRYLGQFPENTRPYCVGLCFSCQLAERIAVQKHDIRMDMVIDA